MAVTSSDIANTVENLADEIVSLRRHLHQYPELSHYEFETTKHIVAKLKVLGFDVHIRDEGTGFYADIAPDNFDPKTGRTIAIRSDLDALAILELNEVPYASKNAGVMHACGHDAHMSVVTGVGLALAKHRERLPGRLRLLFQHAEETTPGGALGMVSFGALDDVTAVLGLHVDPTFDVGKIGVRPGPFTAAFDVFNIKVFGESGHGARPQHCVDPIYVMTQLANALYNAIGRRADARDPMVLSIGQMNAGSAPNIIPEVAQFSGSIRTLSQENHDLVEPLLNTIADGICAAHGATFDLELMRGAPAIRNNKTVTAAIRSAGQTLLGTDNVVEIEHPSMGSEDFSVYLQELPGAMFRLGVGGDGKRFLLHSNRFNIEEQALTIGTKVLASAAIDLMERDLPF